MFFFCGFPIAGMRKKNNVKKKKLQGAGMGYCPVSSLGHDTMELYRDTAGMGAQPRATIRPGLGHDTAELVPRYGHQRATIRLTCTRGVRLLARAWPSQRESLYKALYRG